jgi:hypothetical protein
MNIGFVGKRNPTSVPLGKGFLESIPLLTPEERSSLASLTVDSPAALWAMIEASPEAFDRKLGSARTRLLSGALWHLIPPNERQILANPNFAPPPPVGLAIDDGGPVRLSEPHYDISKRDQLHKELQKLKGQDNPDAKRNAENLERELRTLLRGDRNSKPSIEQA